ncbi:MAG TPA: DUF2269 domain-containing protein [Chloroflexota bacterium]|nr:DUF2269 domain-containing protein [Chloroflexota bacterium]
MSIQAPPSDPRATGAAPELDGRVAPRPAPGAHASARNQAGWRLSPGQRKALVAAHIVLSVGLLGLSTALFVLATAGALTSDPATAQAAYRSMAIFTRGVVQPVAVATLVTGVVLSLGTKWGLFQHTWIVVKLVLTLATILNGMLNLGPSVQRAIALTTNASAATAPDLGTTALVAMAVPGVNVLMLGAATAISVYKPWGRLGRGQGEYRPSAS